ncbi:MAG: DUF3341 domain-containing protein [Anaerolineae bacterium]
MNNEKKPLYGLVAEFEDDESLLEATKQTHDAGYKKFQAYSPYYVEGLGDFFETGINVLPWLVFGGLILGALGGYFLQYYTDVIVYPVNVGGRPFNSWQAFSIITFEAGILTAGLAVAAGMLFSSGLPLPYHPIFNAPGIELASHSRFFLCIEAEDPKFEEGRTRQFLQGLEPTKVSEVTW